MRGEPTTRPTLRPTPLRGTIIGKRCEIPMRKVTLPPVARQRNKSQQNWRWEVRLRTECHKVCVVAKVDLRGYASIGIEVRILKIVVRLP